MTKFVGIDPDADRSGFTVWNSESQKIEQISNEPFFILIEKIKSLISPDLTVVVEAGWLNKKSNYHGRENQSKSVGEKIAKNVGMNQQVGKLFVEFCSHYGINCIVVRPTEKKLTSEEFKLLTGFQKRTNSEMRDSAVLVFGR